MCHSSLHRSFSQSLRIALVAALVVLGVYAAMPQAVLACPGPVGPTYPGTEAFNSTITLQMPFIAGEMWTVGGDGSFYGNNEHCNDPNNDYYATDWNRANDNGAAVLPVADGVVSDIRSTPCPAQIGYGCFVQIDHANGYQTKYAHLSDVKVADTDSVHTWTLIGKVGASGLSDPSAAHLHLTFRHFDNNAYYSHCWNNGQTCPNGETALTPQGYRPSPMMTSLGPTVLQDGQTYTSVNGRIYLPDLRNNNTGWNTNLHVRNDGTEVRTVKISYYQADGTPATYGYDTCALLPNQRCWIPISPDRIANGTIGSAFIDSGEAVTALAVQSHNAPEAWDNYLGVSQPITQVHVPLLHKNNYGLYSEIHLQNPWPTATNMTIRYTVAPGQLGSSCSETYTNVPPRGLRIVQLSNVSCVGSTFVGSAYITNSANNQLAVATTQRKSDQSSLAESSYSGSVANTTYAPLIQNNNYNWIAGMAIQNASEGLANLTATYYNQGGGSPCRIEFYNSTGAHVARIVQTPFAGCMSTASAIFSGDGSPVAVTVNQVVLNSPVSTAYVAAATPSKNVVSPWWRNNSDGWISGLVVQNANSQPANVTITFYGSTGNQSSTPINVQIQPKAIYVASSIGATDGTLNVIADQPVTMVVNHLRNISGDGGMSYTGIPR